MDFFPVAKQTHSRAGFILYGFISVLSSMGLFIVFSIILLGASGFPGNVTYAVLYGYALSITLGLFGLLTLAATPTTGPINTTIRVYKLQAAIITVLPILAALPVLTTRYRWLAGTSAPSIGMLYLVLQIDWDHARTHLQRIRDTDDPASAYFIPQASRTTALHILLPSFLVVMWSFFMGLSPMPFLSRFVMSLVLLFFAIGLLAANPVTNSAERTVTGLQVAVAGAGLSLLITGPVWTIQGGSPIAAGLITLGGIFLLVRHYRGRDWQLVEDCIRELQASDEIAWEHYNDAKANINTKNDSDEQRNTS